MLGAILVYVLSFLSQILMSPPVTARFGMYPFPVVQAAVIWAWYALHVRRLRDADRPTGLTLAIAVLYALAMVLLMLLVDPIIGPDATAVGINVPRANFADLWVFLLLFAAFSAQGGLGFFYFLALSILALILTPVIIAIGFSIWVATRPPRAEVSSAAP